MLTLTSVVSLLTSVPFAARAEAAPDYTTVRPNGDPSNYGFFTMTGCAALWDCIDDDPDSADDTTYLEGSNNTGGAGWLDLGAMPSDFVSATSVDLKVRHMENGSGDDTVGGYYKIVPSDQSDVNALTSETGINPVPTSWTTTSTTVTTAGTNTKASWDGAQLKFGTGYTPVGGADVTTKLRISAAEVNITYSSNATVPPTLSQVRYVFENDDGAGVDANTQLAAGNTALTGVRQGERFTLRTQIKNTGGALTGTDLGLFYDRNDGKWTKVEGAVGATTGNGSCADTAFACTTVESTGDTGADTSIAIDASGSAWVSSRDVTNTALRVAHHVGSGGTGCASTAWTCTEVDNTANVGEFSQIAVSPNGTVWIAYKDRTNNDLKVANSVTSGGNCGGGAWNCVAVDTNEDSGQDTSMTLDAAGNPVIVHKVYLTGGYERARYVRYVGSGGTNCATVIWSCEYVSPLDHIPQFLGLGVDAAGIPWVSYRNAVVGQLGLTVARRNGAGSCTGTTWECTTVDATVDAGTFSSLAIDPAGKPWITYIDVATYDLRVARYVVTGGTGCTSPAWTCTAVDTSADTQYTDIAFAPDGSALISYGVYNPYENRLARHVGSGGNCGGGAWSCNVLEGTDFGNYTSLAFDHLGRAWVAWKAYWDSDLVVANLNRRGEITTSAGLAGANGDALSESHTDMTGTGDTTNRDDADCDDGATWGNGKWFEAENGAGLTMADGSTTPRCTEVAWSLDTSQAVAGTTYRFVVAAKNSFRPDQGAWRGPASVSAYGTLTIQASTPMRLSKSTDIKLGDCTDTSWGCTTLVSEANMDRGAMATDSSGAPWSTYKDGSGDLRIAQYTGGATGGCGSGWTCQLVDDNGDVGRAAAIAFDPSNAAWVSYRRDGTAFDLRVAHYVGSGGIGCGGSVIAWTCEEVDLTGDVGEFTSIAMDPAGRPWVSYRDVTNGNLKVARYVGADGTGCNVASWTCTVVESSNDAGYHTGIAFSPSGQAWVVHKSIATDGDARLARHVGTGGTGCASAAWTCTAVVESSDVNGYTSLAFSPSGQAWVSYQDGALDYKLALYVGSGGTGCGGLGVEWTCSNIDNTGTHSGGSITFSPDGRAWAAYRSDTQTSLLIARYVGTNGTGCGGSTAWTCTTVDNTGSSGSFASLAFDHSGVPWIAYARYTGTTSWKIARPHYSPTPADARYALDDKGYDATTTVDASRESVITQASESPTLVASVGHAANTVQPTVSWTGRSTTAASTRAISVEVYRRGTTDAWETLATNSSCAADTDCVVGATPAGPAAEYYQLDGSYYRVWVRVKQVAESATMTLSTDAMSVAGCTTAFDGSTDNSWQTAANWTADILPISTDYACIPDLTGTPTITHTSGTTNILALHTLEALSLQGSTLNLTSGTSVLNAALTVSGTTASLGGNGNITLNSSLTWTGGTITGSGVLALTGTNDATLSGTDTKTLNGGRDLTVADDVTWSGGNIVMGGSSTFDTTDSFIILPTSTAQAVTDDGSAVTFDAGSVLRNTGSGTGNSTLDVPFVNSNVVTNNAIGALRLIQVTGAGTHSGTFTGGGSGISFLGNHEFSAASSLLSSTSTYNFSSGTMNIAGSVSARNVNVYDNAILTFSGSTYVSTELYLAVPTADVTISGISTIVRANGTCGTLDITAASTIGRLDVGGASLLSFTNTAAVTVTGTVYFQSGTITGAGTLGAASMSMSTAGSKTISGSQDVDITGALTWSGGNLNLGGTANLDIGGATTVSGATARTMYDVNGTGVFATAGIVVDGTVGANTTTIEPDTSLDGAGAVTSTSTLRFSGNSVTATDAANITGAGNLTLATSAFTMPRSVSVGAFTMDATSSLLADIDGSGAGTTFDQVVTSGTATLAGTATISVDGSYVPLSQAAHDVVSASTRSGTTYTSVNGYPAGWTSSYPSAGVFRVISAITAPTSPTGLTQSDSGGSITVWTNEDDVIFAATASDTEASDSLQLCVEHKALNAIFDGAGVTCGSAVAYSGTPVTVSVTKLSYAEGSYHWRAYARDVLGNVSAWVAYGTDDVTLIDFGVDLSAPTTGTVYDGTGAGVDASFNDSSLTALSANWSGFNNNISGLDHYEYSIGTTAGATGVRGWTSTGTTASVTATSLGLRTNQSYFVNVRAVDVAGNTSGVVSSNGQLVSPLLTFAVTPSVDLGRVGSSNAFTSDSADITIEVATNGNGGYQVLAETLDPLENGASAISPFIGGTWSDPQPWDAGDTGFGYTSSDTSIAGQTGTFAGSRYAAFDSPGDVIADHTATVQGGAGLDHTITIGLRAVVPMDQAAGTYVGKLGLSCVVTY